MSNAIIQSRDDFIQKYENALAAKARHNPSYFEQGDLFSSNVRKSDRKQQVHAMMDATHELIVAAGAP
jgi:hypothetical protein